MTSFTQNWEKCVCPIGGDLPPSRVASTLEPEELRKIAHFLISTHTARFGRDSSSLGGGKHSQRRRSEHSPWAPAPSTCRSLGLGFFTCEMGNKTSSPSYLVGSLQESEENGCNRGVGPQVPLWLQGRPAPLSTETAREDTEQQCAPVH